MGGKNAIFFQSWWEAAQLLPTEEMATKYVFEILRYSFEGEVKTDDPILLSLIQSIKPSIDASKARYAKSRLEGIKGGRPRIIYYNKVMELSEMGYTQNEISSILKISLKQVTRILSYCENNPENRKIDINDITLKDMSRHNQDKDIDKDTDIYIDKDKDRFFDDEFVDYSTDQPEMPF